MVGTSTFAAPVDAPAATPPRGAPIAQTFLDDHGTNVSLVATPSGVSCIASRALPIREAEYRDPDGSAVAFDRIVRSAASSIQAIARMDMPVAFRVQLKYPPDPRKPIWLDLGTERFDLTGTVEPSRDSLWFEGPVAEALVDALAQGTVPNLHADSAETARQISDRIDAPDMAGLEACLGTLAAFQSEAAKAEAATAQPTPDAPAGAEPPAFDTAQRTAAGPIGDAIPALFGGTAELILTEDDSGALKLPVPTSGVRLELVARPDPAARLSEEALQGCRMRDIPEELFLGRLTALTGFFSQTQDVYVAFDDAGRLSRAYVPGIFDSDLAEGTNGARLSLAADSNVPDQPNMVRGCLGDARLQAPICVYPGEAEDAYVLAECGVLGVADELGDTFAPYLGWRTPATLASATHGAHSSPRGGGGPGLRGGGSWPPGVTPFPPHHPNPLPPGSGPDDPLPEIPDIPPIPLPAAIWLLAGSLISLSGLRAMRRRLAD